MSEKYLLIEYKRNLYNYNILKFNNQNITKINLRYALKKIFYFILKS